MRLTDTDLVHLRRCVELAREALDTDNDPFGSLLVDSDGIVRFEDHNRTGGGDATRHPEFEIARWAAANLTAKKRASATVYTSGEHCPMCAAAHARVGLGKIVFASSSAQLARWRDELRLPPGPVASLAISVIAPGVPTAGPAPELTDEIRELHRLRCERRQQPRPR